MSDDRTNRIAESYRSAYDPLSLAPWIFVCVCGVFVFGRFDLRFRNFSSRCAVEED